MTTPDGENSTPEQKEKVNGPNGTSAEKTDVNSEGCFEEEPCLDRAKGYMQRKTEANRRNAARSTGPKTPRGKRIVSRNALHHGILVGTIVGMVHDEKIEDFRGLFMDLVSEYEPEGRLEELLVERIATAFWKLKRALQAEQGEIGKAILAADDRLRSADFRENVKELVDWSMMAHLGKHIVGSEKLILKLEQSETGIGFLEGLVRDVRDEIEHTGSLSESGLQQMIRGVDKSWNVYSVKGFAPDLNQRKKAMLQQLDLELSRLDKLKEAVERGLRWGLIQSIEEPAFQWMTQWIEFSVTRGTSNSNYTVRWIN